MAGGWSAMGGTRRNSLRKPPEPLQGVNGLPTLRGVNYARGGQLLGAAVWRVSSPPALRQSAGVFFQSTGDRIDE